ncbi:hypothetical protein F0U61_48395 [Archangium violaceum]|uniref:hypothetical protein n=1 Tax=Archangium violaceum TaxID=83451 RepID=UPI002B2F0A75|nr:hypothetical protein F0U61_48395 [Archangium violaceum]
MGSRAEQGERLHVDREGEVLYLRLEWYTHATWRFLPFALGFLVSGVWGLLARNDALVGFLLSAAFGLLLSYVTTAGLINHTRIKASPREGIAVEHGPFPRSSSARPP